MTIQISSPAANANVTGTVNVVGSTDAVPMITVMDGTTALGSAALPGSFSIPVSTAGLPNGPQTLQVSDGASTAQVAVNVSNGVAPGALSVTTPTPGSSGPATFQLVGISGLTWANIAAYDSATGNKVSGDVIPSGNAFTLSVNMGTLTGPRTLNVTAFSVPAGGHGGTQATVSILMTVVAATPAPSSLPFYGVNGHYFQGSPYSSNLPQQVADMQFMGIKSIRQDCNSMSDIAGVAALVTAFSPVAVQPIFNLYPSGTNETTIYNTYKGYGVTAAQALAGKVAVIELMNEPEVQFLGSPANNGQNITDFASSNSKWPAFRGACRGFVDGWRSVDTTKQTLIAMPSVGWLHYGLISGLWNGTAPEGTSGHPTCRADLVNHHWYLDFGNIENAGNSNTNVLATLQSLFGVPTILTEIGVQNQQTEGTIDSYISSFVAFCAVNAGKYNLAGVNFYELYNDESNNGFLMGLYSSMGVKNAGRAAAMAAVTAANPMG